MRTHRQPVSLSDISYNNIPDRVLFIDIETTGLSPERSFIYMIGLIDSSSEDTCFCSFMAENASEEEDLLRTVIPIIRKHEYLIHYNGDRFDLPFINKRCLAYGMDPGIDRLISIDIYKKTKSLKDILGLIRCKQKDVELFLGIDREDKYSGKELIEVYKKYSESHDEALYDMLYMHNHDDVLGLKQILPLLAYNDLFDGLYTAGEIRRNSYSTPDGNDAEELLITLTLDSPLPVPLCTNADGIFLIAAGDTATLKLPITDSELKFFYDNPKEYYYLPAEDMAVHKSVAMYVDKDHRIQAKAENCYTKRSGTFLPEWSPIYTPTFKPSYDSDTLYFELPDNDLSKEYTDHIIDHLLINKD